MILLVYYVLSKYNLGGFDRLSLVAFFGTLALNLSIDLEHCLHLIKTHNIGNLITPLVFLLKQHTMHAASYF